MTRRQVRVTQQFFDRLDELLPESRTASGGPSATDFLLHDMPNVIDRLADGFFECTMPSGYDDHIRVLVGSGLMVSFFAVYTGIVDDDVEVFYLDVQ